MVVRLMKMRLVQSLRLGDAEIVRLSRLFAYQVRVQGVLTVVTIAVMLRQTLGCLWQLTRAWGMVAC